ncbi:MAG: 2,3-bisphosphoglycerate-independent phosphoglycerate mutase [Methanoregula sp.]|jgi:2,3-bisphosphoglycerate-independent phosphoglycerate mutase|uniref:2,3-bisphosphoglycerate-independent phosphoglycerate mutase n=1 Tax=Methanoregula sp. TaxID=2052170 RepID=UPI003D0B51B3
MTAHKILFIVLDGISDRPCPELGGTTPLAAARTPVLDKLAAEGICGIMDTIAPGIRPGSDTAHLALLGYDPYKYYTGRGPLECEGSGIHMEPGMIGFRCNYATVSKEGIVLDRRAGRIHDTAALSKAIQDGVDLSESGVEFTFRSGAGHRAALALKGEGLGHCVSSNDPKKEGVKPFTITAVKKGANHEKTAAVCNEFVKQSTRILFSHPVNRDRVKKGLSPANIVLMRGAGEMGIFEPFGQKYGLSGSVIAAASLITGIGRVVGLEHVPVPGITGSQDSNIAGKIAAAENELETKDFVLVNIKGADESGHDGLAEQKRNFIEKIDAVLEPLLACRDCIIIICGDHSTPCTIKDHSADPVPVIIRGDGVRMDDVVRFDEYSCAKGGLSRITGPALMPIALDLINRAHKFGA